jgi:hypothetical protein
LDCLSLTNSRRHPRDYVDTRGYRFNELCLVYTCRRHEPHAEARDLLRVDYVHRSVIGNVSPPSQNRGVSHRQPHAVPGDLLRIDDVYGPVIRDIPPTTRWRYARV